MSILNELGADGGAVSLQILTILMNMYEQMILGMHQSYCACKQAQDTDGQTYWGKKLITIATFAGNIFVVA